MVMAHFDCGASRLPRPHGGRLVNLIDSGRTDALRREAIHLPSWDLTFQQTLDLELLLNGAFSPLTGFLGRAAYEHVLAEMRLQDGALWPIPVTLDVTPTWAAEHAVASGARVALRHPEGMVLAILNIEDVWTPDRAAEARAVFGTTDEQHPGVFHLLHGSNPVYLGGSVEGVELPPHHTFQQLRHTPASLRAAFEVAGWDKVVAFQTRNPMHRAHVELVHRAAEATGANVLLHPVAGRTKPGDLDYFVRVRCYQAVLPYFDSARTKLSILPLAMRMGGPREALWHALVRKNFGATHFIVGRDHAGPGNDSTGKPFYAPYDAQRLVLAHEKELGIVIAPSEELVYAEAMRRYVPASELPPGDKALTLSGGELRRRLRRGLELPGWFTYPEVANALRKLSPPRSEQGFTVFFTGLSSSGKSTLANVLVTKLMEDGSRPVTLLDGDLVRKHLSSELGFSREHRDINIRRIGFVASEITKNGGVAVCAPIAPYAASRREVREMIENVGGFVLVHVATPIETCEARDRKGLYAKARAGLIKEFTGVSDPYEPPTDVDIVVDTTHEAPDAGVQRVLSFLGSEGYVQTK